MKKVAIVTIVGFNYGNRLQNYALQQVLMKLGCDVVTLARTAPKSNYTKIKKNIREVAKAVIGTKSAKFTQFDRRIKKSAHYITANTAEPGLDQCFDLFVSGSDQVWNPFFSYLGRSDLLAFARSEQKISYAASFGVEEIPEDKKHEYAVLLKDFRAISVRETRGAEIVADLTGRPAAVVLDPTMLLEDREWQAVEKKPRCFPKGKYVLVYALGEKDSAFREKIESIKDRYEIIDIRAKQKNGRELPVGPAEFLYLVRRADLVLTNSFHATVFSILFHKRFITFNRSELNMYSRIESIANLLELGRNLKNDRSFDCHCDIDYTQVDARLNTERNRSIAFLEASLGSLGNIEAG